MPAKNQFGVTIATNDLIDEGEGVLKVKGKLTLTDGSVQHNGTKYNLETLNVEEYDGTLFANHGDEWGNYTLQTIIGKLLNVKKNSQRVTADGIQYALDNPLGLLAYNLTKSGFANSFSIGTTGPYPDDEGLYDNHALFEVSQVGIPNNRNAKINQVALNTIQEAKEKGQDTSELEQMFEVETQQVEEKDDTMLVRIKNTRSFAVAVKYKNEEGAEVETELKAGEGVNVPEAEVEAVETQIEAAEEPKTEEATSGLKAQLDEQTKVINELKEMVLNKDVKAPEFKSGSGSHKEFKAKDWMQRHADQINAFRSGDLQALSDMNKVHFENLQKENLINNSMTIADMGNFVVSPEMISEIQGCRNNYADFANSFTWRETLSLQMAWLERSGDIDMQPVEMCDDDADGNLKPISEYAATARTANMEELAAVTPVCDAATRFLAADLLPDIAQGYRTDYDRKRAQLIIAKLETAIEANGNSVIYSNASSPSASQNALISYLDMEAEIVDCTPNGVYILSEKSLIELKKRLILAGDGGDALLSQVFFRGSDGVPTINGKRFITVPSDLLPTLNSGETKTFVINGVSVVVNHAVFYVDPSNFTGRTSGGLKYDLSNDAAYEVSGDVRSAFQRNETVVRGSFFRNGAVLDLNQVSALRAASVS